MKLINNLINRWGGTKDSKAPPQPVDDDTVGTGGASSPDKKNRSAKKQTKRKNKSGTASTNPGASSDNAAIQRKILIDFGEVHNKHGSYDELMAFFVSENVLVKFEDGHTIKAPDYVAVCLSTFQSFPDMKFSYDCIKPERSRPNCMVAEDMVISGTHTGAPYGFAYFPPIPATMKEVKNGPERGFYTFDKDTNKISEIQIFSLGNSAGPPGFYAQIGGDLSIPPPGAPPAGTSATEE